MVNPGLSQKKSKIFHSRRTSIRKLQAKNGEDIPRFQKEKLKIVSER